MANKAKSSEGSLRNPPETVPSSLKLLPVESNLDHLQPYSKIPQWHPLAGTAWLIELFAASKEQVQFVTTVAPAAGVA